MSSISREIAFVINNLPDTQTLLAGIPAGTPVHLLDAEGDALAQMAAILADYQGLAAIHLFSHGSQGALHLGSTTLDPSTLNTHAATLADIGAALGENGDILLYGCNVAAGQVGVDFVQRLAQATQADIAASTDITGAASLGGNWTLEQTLGQLATAGLLNPAYRGVLIGSPEIADADDTLAYTKGGAATAIDSTLTLIWADDLALATVSISEGYVSGEDVLGFTDQNGISGSWDSDAGVLTLSGWATQAQYEAALESVTYRNSNIDNPNTGDRTVTWVISDGDAESDDVTSTITVTAGNQAPVLKLPSTLAFAGKVDYATGQSPSSVSSFDVNGDGKPDLLVANALSKTVSVLINQGAGIFAAKADYTTGANPTSVSSADVNGDGKPDLLVANEYAHSVSVLINAGVGTFAAKVDYPNRFSDQDAVRGRAAVGEIPEHQHRQPEHRQPHRDLGGE